MNSILIEQRDMRFAEQLAMELHASGDFTVLLCPGPWPPQRCVRCTTGDCPLTRDADLMIYDPRITAKDAKGNVHNLAVDSALAHPEVPMLLTWPPESAPEAAALGNIRTRAPHVRLAARETAALPAQVRRILEAVGPQRPGCLDDVRGRRRLSETRE